MESMRAHFEREVDLEAAWTGYNPALGRPLLKVGRFVSTDGTKLEPVSTPSAPRAITPAAPEQQETLALGDEVAETKLAAGVGAGPGNGLSRG